MYCRAALAASSLAVVLEIPFPLPITIPRTAARQLRNSGLRFTIDTLTFGDDMVGRLKIEIRSECYDILKVRREVATCVVLKDGVEL